MFNRERVYVFPGAEEVTRNNRERRIRSVVENPVFPQLVFGTAIAVVTYFKHVAE